MDPSTKISFDYGQANLVRQYRRLDINKNYKSSDTVLFSCHGTRMSDIFVSKSKTHGMNANQMVDMYHYINLGQSSSQENLSIDHILATNMAVTCTSSNPVLWYESTITFANDIQLSQSYNGAYKDTEI